MKFLQSLGPLHLACHFNAYGAAEWILDHPEVDVNERAGGDLTPLDIACSANALEVVQLLLCHGADATLVGVNRHTALERAVYGSSYQVTEHLLSNNLHTHNLHLTPPPRSILAYFAGLCEPGRARMRHLLLRYSLLRSPDDLRVRMLTPNRS